MIQEAVSKHIRQITGLLQQQAEELEMDFDYDECLESTRRLCILSNSYVVVSVKKEEVQAVAFAVVMNNGFSTTNTVIISNIYTRNNEAQPLVNNILEWASNNNLTEVQISLFEGNEYNISNLTPVIKTYRIT